MPASAPKLSCADTAKTRNNLNFPETPPNRTHEAGSWPVGAQPNWEHSVPSPRINLLPQALPRGTVEPGLSPRCCHAGTSSALTATTVEGGHSLEQPQLSSKPGPPWIARGFTRRSLRKAATPNRDSLDPRLRPHTHPRLFLAVPPNARTTRDRAYSPQRSAELTYAACPDSTTQIRR